MGFYSVIFYFFTVETFELLLNVELRVCVFILYIGNYVVILFWSSTFATYVSLNARLKWQRATGSAAVMTQRSLRSASRAQHWLDRLFSS